MGLPEIYGSHEVVLLYKRNRIFLQFTVGSGDEKLGLKMNYIVIIYIYIFVHRLQHLWAASEKSELSRFKLHG